MTYWVNILILIGVSGLAIAEDIEGIVIENNGDKIGEMTPEISMDFKITIEPYEQECYYLKLTTNDIFHFIINVLKGGEKKVDILITDPSYKRLYYEEEKTFAWYDNSNVTLNGTYSLCISNQDSHEKLAYVNFISFTKGRIQMIADENNEFNKTSTFISDKVGQIAFNLFKVSRAQTYQRIMSSSDSYMLDANADYVQMFSIIQICVIMVSGVVQTWFIKKLFEMKSSGGHVKF